MNKKILARILCVIFILVLLAGCNGAQSDTQVDDTSLPASASAAPTTDTPEPPPPTAIPPTNTPTVQPNMLDLFDNTVVEIFTLLDGPRVTVARAGQAVMRIDPLTSVIPLEPWIGTATETIVFTLEYDPAADQYLLSIQTANYLNLEDFPLTYVDGTGFSGTGIAKSGDREYNTTATIMPSEEGYAWSIGMVDTAGVYSVTYEFETTPGTE